MPVGGEAGIVFRHHGAAIPGATAPAALLTVHGSIATPPWGGYEVVDGSEVCHRGRVGAWQCPRLFPGAPFLDRLGRVTEPMHTVAVIAQ